MRANSGERIRYIAMAAEAVERAVGWRGKGRVGEEAEEEGEESLDWWMAQLMVIDMRWRSRNAPRSSWCQRSFEAPRLRQERRGYVGRSGVISAVSCTLTLSSGKTVHTRREHARRLTVTPNSNDI